MRTARSRLTRSARSAWLWLAELGGRTIALLVGAVVVVAAVGVTGYLLSRTETKRQLPDTRARSYKDVDACLLTGKDGITAGTTAAEVWEGMRDASLRTHARVSYVPVTGEQSAANARPYLDGLLQRSCDVVLAAGTPQVEAAEQAAPLHRKVGFVLVGGEAGGGSGSPDGLDNVTVARPGAALRAEVAGAVERRVGAPG